MTFKAELGTSVQTRVCTSTDVLKISYCSFSQSFTAMTELTQQNLCYHLAQHSTLTWKNQADKTVFMVVLDCIFTTESVLKMH